MVSVGLAANVRRLRDIPSRFSERRAATSAASGEEQRERIYASASKAYGSCHEMAMFYCSRAIRRRRHGLGAARRASRSGRISTPQRRSHWPLNAFLNTSILRTASVARRPLNCRHRMRARVWFPDCCGNKTAVDAYAWEPRAELSPPSLSSEADMTRLWNSVTSKT